MFPALLVPLPHPSKSKLRGYCLHVSPLIAASFSLECRRSSIALVPLLSLWGLQASWKMAVSICETIRQAKSPL